MPILDDTMDDAPEHDAPHAVARVDLSFEPSGKSVRVPSGVSVFDAASWNGIAIDSTCGGHGTCKKCKVQIVEGSVPVGRLDSRAFDPDELRGRLAPGLHRATPRATCASTCRRSPRARRRRRSAWGAR